MQHLGYMLWFGFFVGRQLSRFWSSLKMNWIGFAFRVLNDSIPVGLHPTCGQDILFLHAWWRSNNVFGVTIAGGVKFSFSFLPSGLFYSTVRVSVVAGRLWSYVGCHWRTVLLDERTCEGRVYIQQHFYAGSWGYHTRIFHNFRSGRCMNDDLVYLQDENIVFRFVRVWI